MNSRPRYGTTRRPDRPTNGPAVGVVAGTIGYRLLPWQTHVADTAGELVPDPETGVLVPAYHTVVVSVGRRAGKSLLILARLLECALTGRGRRAWYTAQARSDAALTLRDDWAPAVAASGLHPNVSARLSNGSEAFVVARLASFVRVFAPTPTSLHGQAGDLIVFDEAWSHSAGRGAELEVAARPLMATRPGAQTWILSAAGDIDSTWWADWLDRGRAAADTDRGRGVAHFEWSADAPGLDLDDPAVWLESHPAVRSADNPAGTISLDWLREEHADNPDQFRRTYLNVTDRAGVTAAPIDPEAWHRLAVDAWSRAGVLVAGVDSAPEQSATAIVVAGIDNDLPVVELIDHRPGIDWAVGRLADLTDRYRLFAVAVDPGSPAGALIAPATAAGVPIVEMSTADVAAAAAQMVEAVRTSAVRHVASPGLDTAATGARRRPLRDGSWTFGRIRSSVDVAPVIAAAAARWAHPDLNRPAPGVF